MSRTPRLAVIHCGFTYSGGGERIVLEEVLGLRRRGYAVDCYAPTVDVTKCYPDLIGAVAPRTLLPPFPKWLPFHDAANMLAAALLAPFLILYMRRYDGFIGANQPGVWIAWVVGTILRRPVLGYFNQPNRLVYPRKIDLETGWQNVRDYYLLARIIKHLTALVRAADWASVRGVRTLLVDGAYIGGVIGRTYRREVRDCPAGCHPETNGHQRPMFAEGVVEAAGARHPKPFVLLTNRHEPQKRFDLVIRAFQEVVRRVPQATLLIPGPFTDHTPSLLALSRELGMDGQVRFLGRISEAELQRLYAEAAVYVYPSPEEDFGMGIVEAMAKSVPVVAWRNAGPTVTVDDGVTGFLATPFETCDYAQHVARLLKDPCLNERMGRAALERARHSFTWARHVDTIVEELEGAGVRP